jgi:chemotaxis protein MotA
MDIATIIGLILGFGLVAGAIMIGGTDLTPFIDVPSAMIVIGGCIASLLINFPLGRVIGGLSVVKKCFLTKLPSPDSVISQFKELANVVRKDGMLALESHVEKCDDKFLKRGMEILIGGAEPAQIQNSLEMELSAIEARHALGKKLIDGAATAAPAFGMIGTLVGLVQMLRKLDDPSKVGAGMAVALLTTLYGALIANVACIPLAGKLETRSQEEILIRELMIAGLVSLSEGLSPRAVEDKLIAFLSPTQRRKLQSEAA